MQRLGTRRPRSGTIFHAIEVWSSLTTTYVIDCCRSGFVQSVNRPRRITDNAHRVVAQTLKSDLYHRRSFNTDYELRGAVRNYIGFTAATVCTRLSVIVRLSSSRQCSLTTGCPLLRRELPAASRLGLIQPLGAQKRAHRTVSIIWASA